MCKCYDQRTDFVNASFICALNFVVLCYYCCVLYKTWSVCLKLGTAAPQRGSVTWALTCNHGNHVKGTSRGKTIPIQAWTGSYGSRSLKLPEL